MPFHTESSAEAPTKSPPAMSFSNCSASTSSIVEDGEANGVCDVDCRPDGLSSKKTLVNFVKGMIGPGCMALPVALKYGGLWMGLSLILLFGFLTTYAMIQLSRAAQRLSRMKGQVLDYGQVAYESCQQSFEWAQKFAVPFNGTLVVLQVGVCAIVYIFIAAHAKEVVEELTSFRASVTTWYIIFFPIIGSINLIRTLKTTVIVSIIGNVCLFTTVAIVLVYLSMQPHKKDLPAVTDVNGFLIACTAVLYSFEGQAMVIPMTNKLQHPERMVGPFGVLAKAMGLVTILYTACGLLGYLTYGDDVQGSITLNLPNTPLFITIKAVLGFVIWIGFGLPQYVVIDTTWPLVRRALKLRPRTLFFDFCFEGLYRTFVLFIEMLLAILVPTLADIIPLVGATAGMLLAFVFPALIDTLTNGPTWIREHPRGERWNRPLIWGLIRNGFLFALGIFGMVAGLQANLTKLIMQDGD